jgi:hypothetical protein
MRKYSRSEGKTSLFHLAVCLLTLRKMPIQGAKGNILCEVTCWSLMFAG